MRVKLLTAPGAIVKKATPDEADRWRCSQGPCVYAYPDVRSPK